MDNYYTSIQNDFLKPSESQIISKIEMTIFFIVHISN